MRTTAWSLAALAGGALAAPGWEYKPPGGYGTWGEGDSWGESSSTSWGLPSTGVSSSSSATSTSTSVETSSSSAVSSSSTSIVSAVTPSTSSTSVSSSTPVSSLTSSKTTTPVGPGSYSYSFSTKKAATTPASSITKSGWSKPSFSWSPPEWGSTTYVTEFTTLYTTVCPATKTHVTSGTTETTTFITTSTVTSVGTSTVTAPATTYVTEYTTEYTTVCPATETHVTSGTTETTTFITTSTVTSVGTSTITAPVSPPATTESTTYVTEYTTEYTTVCPATETYVTSGSTATTTFITTSTVTSIATSTITAPVTTLSPPETTGPISPPESTTKVYVTKFTTAYTTICPATETEVISGTTFTSVFDETSTITSEWESTNTVTVSAGGSGPAVPETTVTDVTTVYTTVCPATETITSGASTYTTTVQTTSTVTSVYQSTITVTPGWSDIPWSTVPWGTTVLTYPVTQPITFQSTSTSTSAVGPVSPSVSGSIKGSSGPKPSGSVTTKKPIGTGSVSKPYSSGVSTRRASGTAPIIKSSSTTSSHHTKPTESCVPCKGQPGNDPAAWCGYTVHDNSYEVMPITCRTVTYDLHITNTTLAPDGVARTVLTINGQMPGPLIEANWGDTIVVNVHNELSDNGTAIHFHGQRQNYTNEYDGVPSITQCPIAPGKSQTYTFKASNYGSSWYHSHYALQLYDGVFGPMVVHGPASAGYDEEEFIVIQDWNHVGVNVLYDASQTVGNAPSNGPQTLDTGLINGKNVFNLSGSAIGERYQLNVKAGKTYRLRLVNTAIQTTFKFYLDQHTFQVIAADYVPLVPYTTNILNINTGQRYDVLFKADQPVGNYWLRADGQQSCTALKNSKDIKAVVSYEGAPAGLPTSTAYTYAEECVDEPLASIVPVVNIPVGAQSSTITENILIGGNGATPNLYKWTLSGTTFQSQYGDPSLVSIVNNGSVPSYSGNLAIEVPNLGEWVYVIIESPIPVPHPIHLHGHDFMILAQGYGSYSSSVALNTATPARRDTVLMPGNRGQAGYVVVAFKTDNPGAWLMHCHIGWHAAMGFALQILENVEGIKDTVAEPETLNEVCSAWADYASATDFHVEDSGI